jgi:outer membrane protein
MKIKLPHLFLVVALLLPHITKAQENTVVMSLEECIAYALENTAASKNAVIDQELAKAKVRETRGIGLPQVDASAGIQHNIKLPRFYMQYDPNGGTMFGDMSQIPNIQDGDVVAIPNFFQLPSSGSASVSVSQLFFNASYLVGLKAANTYKALAEESASLTNIEVIEKVKKAYYNVVINKERIQLFDNNIARIDSLLRTTKALNENGFAEDIDVDRIVVTLNNIKSERIKFINLQALSLGLLKMQMNYPIQSPLDVKNTIQDIQMDAKFIDEVNADYAYENRVEYRQLEVQRKLQQLNLKNKYAEGLPSLVGFFNGGYSTQSPNIAGVFRTESKHIPSTDMFGPDKFYPFASIGLSLNIPIFSGLQRSSKIQQERLNLLKIENGFSSLKQSLDLDVQNSLTTFNNAVETLEMQKQNVALAEKVARVTKVKYEQGVGSNLEVTDAESSLREAQINYYNALFDLVVSKIDYERATGKIDPNQYSTK